MHSGELILGGNGHTPQYAIQRWTNIGFSLETLCLITKIPVSILVEIKENGFSNELVNGDKLKYLMLVIMLLEKGTPDENEQEYLSNILDSIIGFFRVDIKEIAHYLRLTESELTRFKNDTNCVSLPEKQRISMMLMHLYVTLIRNPVFSIDAPLID